MAFGDREEGQEVDKVDNPNHYAPRLRIAS